MEGELENRFFTACAPRFFSEELQRVINSSRIDENYASNEFLRVMDTLVSLLFAHNISLNAIIPCTVQGLIVKEFSNTSLVFFT